MNIVELINTLEIGGAERMVVDLACGLHDRGHNVSVVCLRRSGPLASVLQQNSIEVLTLDKDGPGLRPRVVKAFARILRERSIDVVHTHNPLVHHYGALASRMAGVPVTINTLHGPSNLMGFGQTEAVFEMSCLLSTKVIACCQAVHDHLQRVSPIGRRRSGMIRNGIALDRFTAIEPRSPGVPFVFGMVGRLVPVKDHKTALEAFAHVLKMLPDCRLELLGDGSLRHELEQHAQSLGIEHSVCFHGSSLDVGRFLAQIHAFVLCSLSEGLPLTVLEAMAAGLPVVGTTVGAMPELVNGSSCGWLAAPGSSRDLAQAMIRAATDPDRTTRGLRGRDYVVQHHSLQAMITDYERLFEDMLADSRQTRVKRSWDARQAH